MEFFIKSIAITRPFFIKIDAGNNYQAVAFRHLGKNDKLSLASDRKSVTHPPGDATKEIVTYNRVTVSLDLRAGKSGSQLKAVRSEMNELAMAALSK